MNYSTDIVGGGQEQATTGRISRETAFQLLQNRRRRFAIHYLKRVETTEIGEVAEQVAAWENDISIDAVGSTERKNVYNSLQQTHFPKLDDHGFVEYDQQSGVVELTDASKELDIYLEVVPHQDIPWSEYYLGLSVIGAALVTVLWANVQPFALLPNLVWVTGFMLVFIISALGNFYYQRQARLGEKEKPPEVVRDS